MGSEVLPLAFSLHCFLLSHFRRKQGRLHCPSRSETCSKGNGAPLNQSPPLPHGDVVPRPQKTWSCFGQSATFQKAPAELAASSNFKMAYHSIVFS